MLSVRLLCPISLDRNMQYHKPFSGTTPNPVDIFCTISVPLFYIFLDSNMQNHSFFIGHIHTKEWRYFYWTQVFNIKYISTVLSLFSLNPKMIFFSVVSIQLRSEVDTASQVNCILASVFVDSEILHCEMVFLRALTDCHINLMQHYAAGV